MIWKCGEANRPFYRWGIPDVQYLCNSSGQNNHTFFLKPVAAFDSHFAWMLASVVKERAWGRLRNRQRVRQVCLIGQPFRARKSDHISLRRKTKHLHPDITIRSSPLACPKKHSFLSEKLQRVHLKPNRAPTLRTIPHCLHAPWLSYVNHKDFCVSCRPQSIPSLLSPVASFFNQKMEILTVYPLRRELLKGVSR